MEPKYEVMHNWTFDENSTFDDLNSCDATFIRGIASITDVDVYTSRKPALVNKLLAQLNSMGLHLSVTLSRKKVAPATDEDTEMPTLEEVERKRYLAERKKGGTFAYDAAGKNQRTMSTPVLIHGVQRMMKVEGIAALSNELHDQILKEICDPAADGQKGYNIDALHYLQTDPLVRANMASVVARHGVHFKFPFSLETKADINFQARMGSDPGFRVNHNRGREVHETAFDLLTACRPHPLIPLQTVTLEMVQVKNWSIYGLAQVVMMGYMGNNMTDTTERDFENGFKAHFFEGLVDGGLSTMFREKPQGFTMVHVKLHVVSQMCITSVNWRKDEEDLVDFLKSLINLGVLLKYQRPSSRLARREKYGMKAICELTWLYLTERRGMPMLSPDGLKVFRTWFMNASDFDSDSFEGQMNQEVYGGW